MYEAHFGLTGAPFLLNPDPGFYFDSRGHSSALSYLKFGLYQAEGFIVVTGDIGAGKTTLVRTLLSDIDNEKVVAAQLVSTQLEAGDLLRSTIAAFGVPLKGQSKAELIATLEAYLTLLATQRKRAVLIVDEAQNLSRDAIEELRMLSNFQFGNQALLQSFLIGQPELRDMLLSRSLEQLRQRVIASYHLGPMDREETRQYIEHRLKKVGWQDRPHFDDDSFDEIFQWTSGIPRRINLLCNRVLLAAYLKEADTITTAEVSRVGMEMRAEIGEPIALGQARDLHRPIAEAGMGAPHAAHALPRLNESVPEGQAHEANLQTSVMSSWAPAGLAGGHTTPVFSGTDHSRSPCLLMITGSRSGCIRAAAMQRAMGARQDMPPLKWVCVETPGRFELASEWTEHMGLRPADVTIRAAQGTSTSQAADAWRQLDLVMRELNPEAVLVQNGDEAAMLACLTAHRCGIPIVHIEAGLRSFDRRRGGEIHAMICDHAADLLLTSEWVAHDNLAREGIPADRVVFVGNLLMDTIRQMLPQASAPKYTLRQFNQSAELLKSARGYGLVYLQDISTPLQASQFEEIATVLSSVCKDLSLIWTAQDSVLKALQADARLTSAGPGQLGILPIVPYHKMIGLLGSAACVFTDSSTVQEEATILGVPCLTLNNHTERRITVEQGTNIAVGHNPQLVQRAVSEIMRGAGKRGRLPKFWDGMAAQRSAEHIAAWLRQHRPAPSLHGARMA